MTKVPAKILNEFFLTVHEIFLHYPSPDIQKELLVPIEDLHSSCTTTSPHEVNDEEKKPNPSKQHYNIDGDDGLDREHESVLPCCVPVSLEKHRYWLLSTQIRILTDIVSRYNSNSKETILTLDDVQRCLRNFGTYAHVQNKSHTSEEMMDIHESIETYISFPKQDNDDNESVIQTLVQNMHQMNHSARLAFVRSILWAEITWSDRYMREGRIPSFRSFPYTATSDDDDAETSRNDTTSSMVEFCTLCTLAVSIPQIQHYLSRGTNIFVSDPMIDEELIKNTTTGSVHHRHLLTPRDRLLFLQNMILRSLGYNVTNEFDYPQHRRQEIPQEEEALDHSSPVVSSSLFLLPPPLISMIKKKKKNDSDIDHILMEFVSNMETAITNATLQSNQVELSDYKDGGVTRVVSVTYSERIIHDPILPLEQPRESESVHKNGNSSSCVMEAPTSTAMEQQTTYRQKIQLEMAKQAATIQHNLLEELIQMDEGTRNALLQEAKTIHDHIMKEALQIAPGVERVVYLQSIDSKTQRMLILHKMWEQFLHESLSSRPHAD